MWFLRIITLKVKEVLFFYDCVIYDRLVDESALQFLNCNAKLAYLRKEHEKSRASKYYKLNDFKIRFKY